MGRGKAARGTSSTVSTNVRSGGSNATPLHPATTKVSQAKTRPSARGGTITHEQIAQRAREVWIKSGCEPGRDEQNWLEAEAQLKAELAGE